MNHRQLTEGQRHLIQAYLSQRLSYREIGRRLNVSHPSINRELKRYAINGMYDPSIAQQRVQYRRCQAAKSQISQKAIAYVEFGLSLDWSS